MLQSHVVVVVFVVVFVALSEWNMGIENRNADCVSVFGIAIAFLFDRRFVILY